MYQGSIEHGVIISAITRNVPGTYVRDYRGNDGYITIARGYRNIPWRDQQSAPQVYKQVPVETIMSLPRGNVTAATRYRGMRLDRPGWRAQFREAMPKLSEAQMRRITKEIGAGEVFPGIR